MRGSDPTFDGGLGQRGFVITSYSIHYTKLYDLLSKRFLNITASEFITMRKARSTIIAADVLSTKARSGLSAQRKIWTGRAVAGSVKPEGISTIKATMPIISSGRNNFV